MTDCIDIETDGLYRIGTDFDQDDGITVILKDNDDDWWVNGTDPPPDVHSLLRAWRHFQSFVSHSFNCVIWNLRLHWMSFLVQASPV